MKESDDQFSQKNIVQQCVNSLPRSMFASNQFDNNTRSGVKQCSYKSSMNKDQQESIHGIPVRTEKLGPPNSKKNYRGIGPFMFEQKQANKQTGQPAKKVSNAQLMMLYPQASKSIYMVGNLKLILNRIHKDGANEKQDGANKKQKEPNFFTIVQEVDLFYMERVNHVQMILNSLKTVDMLSKLFLVNLQILDLSRNNIQSIEQLSFCYFPNLSYLSLHNNRITSIDTLRSCVFTFLQTLLLDNNYIHQIGRLSDSKLPYLESFQIYRNYLVDIPPLYKMRQYSQKHFNSTQQKNFLTLKHHNNANIVSKATSDYF